MELGTIQDENHILMQAYTNLKDFSLQDTALILLGTSIPKRLVASLPLHHNHIIDGASLKSGPYIGIPFEPSRILWSVRTTHI